MNDLDNHVDPDFEEHLRHVLSSVAATSGPADLHVIEWSRQRRGHRLVGALAALLLLAGASATAWIASRPDAQRTGTSLPGWYQAVAPSLPEGFEHVAVTWSNESFVTFQAINPTSPALLYFNVSREPTEPNRGGTITVEQLRSGADPDLPVTLPDGREILVDCQVITLASADRMVAPCADVTASQRRALALALAVDLDPEQLPGPAAEDSALESSLAMSVESVTNLRSDGGISRPNWGYAQYSELGHGESAPLLQIRYAAGLVPPLGESERTRRSASTDGATITWQGLPNGWLVMAVTRSPLDPATGGRILDAAATHRQAPATTTAPPSTGQSDSRTEGPISSFEGLRSGETITIVDTEDVSIVARFEPLTTAPYCLDLRLGDFAGPACVDQGSVFDGRTSFALPSRDGSRQLVGQIVSDLIATVLTSDGRTITPASNVWWDVADANSATTYVVRTIDGRTSQPLPISAGGSPTVNELDAQLGTAPATLSDL